ncbi:transposase, partial [Candidatus Poribacteria bacterium]|nr:transposase [Candidatus Poribacteria bacterium]
QLTGIEKCQCRLPRIVRNHITCAFLVWIFLKQKADETGKTLYQVKNDLLSDYLCQQLRSPTLKWILRKS